MDAYQQRPHNYMRPQPLPSQPPLPTDPHLHFNPQYHHQPPPPPPPRASAPPAHDYWFSNKFHYQQHHNQSHSAPSPHPQQPPSHWGPPSLFDHSVYPPPLLYPPHPHNVNNHFPPPPPPPPPPPYMPPAQVSHSFSHVNQEWSNTNWSHQQAQNNVEDWGAKAREWAKSRGAMQDQPVQSQITPVARPEEQNPFHDPYTQTVDSHYMDTQQSLPTSSYQQFPVPASSPHRPPMVYYNEVLNNNSVPSSHIPNERMPYTVRDGSSALEPNNGFLHQESLPTSSSVHEQEVPSCYSSISGKEDSANQEQSYNTLPLPISSSQEAAYHMQPAMPDTGRSVRGEQSFVYGSQATDTAADISDRPLEFAPRFNNDCDQQVQSNYAVHHESMGSERGIDPVAAASSINSWTLHVVPGAVYPPVHPVLPPGTQHDPSLAVPSPVSGHTAPSFPRFPGPIFQPSIPSSATPFGLSTGPPLHPAAPFPIDMYGTISERPKKGPVPNWLKEEILRSKATIPKSSLEHPKEETESIEDEAVDTCWMKGDQADSKSVETSRSTEEEGDDDEDYVEAARMTAINQEIKRVLTEVLLKVTDELFDEIATKVVNEDDSAVEVDHKTVASNHKASPSSSPVPVPKASARVLVPGKAKEPELVVFGEKSSSSSPGNVLGLANYASEDEDENEDKEIQCSHEPDLRSNATVVESSPDKLPQDKLQEGNNGSRLNDTLREQVIGKSDSELPGKKSTKSEAQVRETEVKSDKNKSRMSSFGKDPGGGREIEVSRSKEEDKGPENCQREDEGFQKSKTRDRNDPKERIKEHKTEERAKESDKRKRYIQPNSKDDKKDRERSHRASAKDVERKRERTKEDRSREKRGSDSSRQKRRRSSSISSRGKNRKDNSSGHVNDSSDEVSDGSKRKLHSRKHLSPSPVRSRRRQVSGSPHSKHSQRRHSPYSSFETTRGRRSRSRSPARRER